MHQPRKAPRTPSKPQLLVANGSDEAILHILLSSLLPRAFLKRLQTRRQHPEYELLGLSMKRVLHTLHWVSVGRQRKGKEKEESLLS
jgi:hypothetical protein